MTNIGFENPEPLLFRINQTTETWQILTIREGTEPGRSSPKTGVIKFVVNIASQGPKLRKHSKAKTHTDIGFEAGAETFEADNYSSSRAMKRTRPVASVTQSKVAGGKFLAGFAVSLRRTELQ